MKARTSSGFQTALRMCRTDDGERGRDALDFAVFSAGVAERDGSSMGRRGVSEGSTMAKPTVVVVGADKGGVGKTTVARTVLDYFTAHHVPARAFDSEAPKARSSGFTPT